MKRQIIGRRASLRRLNELHGALVLTLLLASCASHPEAGFLAAPTETGQGSTEVPVLVATTRERDTRPGTLYNGERTSRLDYAAVTVSIPPKHVPGEIEWPSLPVGHPAVEFVANKAGYLKDEADFIRALNAQLAQRPRGSRKVLLFIHGYNTVFAEALFRIAQVDFDAGATDVPVLFAWASRGRFSDYIYDSNSALAARDELAHILKLLFASNADEINILAHSMGNLVTVEALRQLKISGQIPHNNKIGSVILAAPDIDLDVFKSELRAFPKPHKPFYVIVSKDDQALQTSSFLAGQKARLGAVADEEELARLGATVIDLTDLKSDDPANHGKYAQLATIAPQLLPVLAKGIGKSRAPGASERSGDMSDILAKPLAIPGGLIRIVAGQ